MSSTVERHAMSRTRLAVIHASARKIIAEWQPHGPAPFSGYVSRKLRVSLVPLHARCAPYAASGMDPVEWHELQHACYVC